MYRWREYLVPVPFLRCLDAISAVHRGKSIVNEASRYYSRPIMAERNENNIFPILKRCGLKLYRSDCDGRTFSTLFVTAIVVVRKSHLL